MSAAEEGTEIKKADLVESVGQVEEDKAPESEPKVPHEEIVSEKPVEHKDPHSDIKPPEVLRSRSSSSSSSLVEEVPVKKEDKIVPIAPQIQNYKQRISEYYSKAKEIVIEKKMQVGVLAATVGGVIAITALRKWRKRS